MMSIEPIPSRLNITFINNNNRVITTFLGNLVYNILELLDAPAPIVLVPGLND